MKRNIISILLIICVSFTLILCGCSEEEKPKEKAEYSFKATILEINDNSVLVQPLDGEEELKSSDKISFSFEKLEKIDITVGSEIKVFYNGEIMESYPAQIVAEKWELCSRAGEYYFIGTILEINGSSVLMQPTDENASSMDKVLFNTNNLPTLKVAVGDKILVTYNGQVMYSYPAQINPITWQIIN